MAKHEWPSALVGDPGCALPGHDQGCFSMKGRDSAGVAVFEVRDAHKGDTARAILYFSTRYGQACAPLPLAQLDPVHPAVTEALLRQWHAVDPPDALERARNDQVEAQQGVRNPFVDHPELVERLAFR